MKLKIDFYKGMLFVSIATLCGYTFDILQSVNTNGLEVLNNATSSVEKILHYLLIGLVLALLTIVFLVVKNKEVLYLSKPKSSDEVIEEKRVNFFNNLSTEVDRTIMLRARLSGYCVFISGFVISLITIYSGFEAGIMIVIMFIAFLLALTIENFIRVLLYKKEN